MRTFIFIITLFLFNFGCSGAINDSTTESSENRVKIVRFDTDFYNHLSGVEEFSDTTMQEKYADFLPFFSVITIGSEEVDWAKWQRYFSHPQLHQLYADTEQTFADLSAVEEELTLAASIAADNFDKKLPAFYAHVSGLKQNAIVSDSLISLSLDKYLGSDYELYKSFFEPYQRVDMSAEHIAKDYLKAWILSEIITETNHKDLLQAIVAEGKVLYLLQTLLPNRNQTELLGYSAKQMEWSTKNEKQIWRTIIGRKHLYGTDALVISGYISDASYTTALAPDSAPRIGQYIGWQIVNRYMKNSKKTIDELLQEPADEVLRISKYNP